jgi:hypothetical protein
MLNPNVALSNLCYIAHEVNLLSGYPDPQFSSLHPNRHLHEFALIQLLALLAVSHVQTRITSIHGCVTITRDER